MGLSRSRLSAGLDGSRSLNCTLCQRPTGAPDSDTVPHAYLPANQSLLFNVVEDQGEHQEVRRAGAGGGTIGKQE